VRQRSSSSTLADFARVALRVFLSRSVTTLVGSRIMPGCVGGSLRDRRRDRAKARHQRGLWVSRRCSIEDAVLRSWIYGLVLGVTFAKRRWCSHVGCCLFLGLTCDTITSFPSFLVFTGRYSLLHLCTAFIMVNASIWFHVAAPKTHSRSRPRPNLAMSFCAPFRPIAL
jgi:hypothetical protein